MLKLADLAKRPDFRLGPLLISPSRRLVEGPAGQSHVEPLVMQVFLLLLDARGEVVTRQELFDQAWGGVMVGDDSLNRAISGVRRIAAEAGDDLFEIETVPRTGYRLAGKILKRRDTIQSQTKLKGWWRMMAGGLVALLLAAAGVLIWQQRGATLEPASIAVLPFRNLAGGTPYFAEGVGDEISVQLSREPHFRLVGRMSAGQLGNDGPLEVGRKLNVDYVLEGSVRAQGEQVRVTTALIRTSDGVQLWSNNYDGQLGDIIAIQQQIGSSVAGALKRRLVHKAERGSVARSAEAQNLYLTARGMLRARQPGLAPQAADLLRQAIRLDPGYAPAWSSLAQALRFADPSRTHETVIAVLPHAERFARHSIRLDPQRAEGHATLGMLLGFTSPEARSALDRAIELEPNNVEVLVWLATSQRASGEFGLSLANYRRALELDPSWGRAIRDLAVSTAEMGDRSAADLLVARAPATNETHNNLHARVAWVAGDFSEAIRRWSLVTGSDSPRAELASQFVQDALFEVGLGGAPLPDWPPNVDGRLENRRVRLTAPPSPSVWSRQNRSKHAALIYRKENRVGAKLMLNAGRARELIATFDSSTGLLGIRPGQRLRGDLLMDAPTVVQALRRVGRNPEADRLLKEGDAIIRATDRRGPVPFSFDVDASAIWALQGRRDEALSRLERAFQRGWVHIGDSDLKDIADEPAFASLLGHPRFERMRRRIRDHYQRERLEIERMQI